ncbi:MAG: enoyl-CoA hydratase-related protein [Acidimicrobiia bacterium]
MIEYFQRDAIGVLTINRPERRNALNAELCEEMRTQLSAIGSVIRVLVVTGSGEAFCAGADLAQRQRDHGAPAHGGLDSGGKDTFRPSFDALCDDLAALPVPVIAAVRGPALGAGMQLAVACDLRVASPEAVFGIPSGKLGVMLSPRNIVRMRQVMGASIARAVLIGGELLDGTRSHQLGFVHRLDTDPLAAAMTWADAVAHLAPLSVGGHKAALNIADPLDLTEADMVTLKALETRAFASDDLREGLTAFVEKRRPEFHGR